MPLAKYKGVLTPDGKGRKMIGSGVSEFLANDANFEEILDFVTLKANEHNIFFEIVLPAGEMMTDYQRHNAASKLSFDIVYEEDVGATRNPFSGASLGPGPGGPFPRKLALAPGISPASGLKGGRPTPGGAGGGAFGAGGVQKWRFTASNEMPGFRERQFDFFTWAWIANEWYFGRVDKWKTSAMLLDYHIHDVDASVPGGRFDLRMHWNSRDDGKTMAISLRPWAGVGMRTSLLYTKEEETARQAVMNAWVPKVGLFHGGGGVWGMAFVHECTTTVHVSED